MDFWIPLAMAGASLLQEKNNADATERFNKGQAEITRYSPWTGMKGQMKQNSPNYLGAGLKGGLQGYMLGNAICGGAGGTPLEGKAAMVDYENLGINVPQAGAMPTAPANLNNSWLSNYGNRRVIG